MSTSLSVSAVRPKAKHPDESILFGVDFSRLLVAGENLSAVSGVASTPAGLTISSQAVNGAPFDNDEGQSVSIGKGAQFRIVGGTAGTDYALTVTVTTSAGNTRVAICQLQVRDS